MFVLLRLTFCSHGGVFGEIQRGNNRKEAEVDHQRARPDRPPVFTRYSPPIHKNFTRGSSTKLLSPTTLFWFVTALTKIFTGHVTVAFTMTAHPLDPKWPIREVEVAEHLAGRIADDERMRGSALSDYPPLHCRCRSRARASLRNRQRGPSRMGCGGQVRELQAVVLDRYLELVALKENPVFIPTH
jgi:hypothetical protein